MRTVYTTFPIYDSTDKQDYNRTGQLRALYCPRYQFPPFQFEGSSAATVSDVQLVDCNAATSNVTSYFETLPAVFDLTDNEDYIQYKGDTLNTLLPYGSYYLKMEDDNDNIYYSDWFLVEDIYPNQIATLANSTYDTLTTSGPAVTSAISDGVGATYGGSVDSFDVVKDEVIKVIFNLTLTSGVAPDIALRISINSTARSNIETTVAGLNEIDLTVTKDDTVVFSFKNGDGDAGNWSTNEIYVVREYSPSFIKLKFSNTKDLPTQTNEPTILYQDSWYDEMWFKTELNTTEGELTRVGTEKNGVFIAEKLVSVYRYKIVDYIGRNLYKALHRLPLHDDVEIIDTVGMVYDVGHDIQTEMSWTYWDMGTLTLKFNDGASYWEGNADNLT